MPRFPYEALFLPLLCFRKKRTDPVSKEGLLALASLPPTPNPTLCLPSECFPQWGWAYELGSFLETTLFLDVLVLPGWAGSS